MGPEALLGAWLVIAVAGCGSGAVDSEAGRPTGSQDSEDCLATDVAALPRGSAGGNEWSGRYRSVTNLLEDCYPCERNELRSPCADVEVWVRPQASFDIIHDNGLLIVEDEQATLTGGVDSDGHFEIGGFITPYRSNGLQTGRGLVVLRGEFDRSGFTASMVVRVTGNFNEDDLAETSDIQWITELRAERVGE